MGMGGGGKSTTTQTTVQELSPEQRELLKPVIPVAKEFVANPPKQYEGSAIAPFNPLQQQAQQMTLQAAQNIGQATAPIPGQVQQTVGNLGANAGAAQQAAGGVMEQLNPSMAFSAGAAGQTAGQVQQGIQQGQAQTQPGLNFLTSGQVLDPNNNQYLQQAVDAASRPAIRQFQNVILPGIASDAISAGGFGGTRQGIAEGLAAQGLQQQLGDISANMFSNAYGQGLSAMNQGLNSSIQQTSNNLNAMVNSGQLTQQAANQIMQAQLGGFGAQNSFMNTAQSGLGAQIQGLSQLPGILQSTLLPTQLTASVGEQQQAMQQALLSEQVQKFVNEQLIPFAAAQDVAALAFGVPAGTSRTNASSTGGGGGGISGMQMASAGASLLPLMLGKSQRSEKQNIVPIGALPDGLVIYNFEYKDQPGLTYTGLMADEVREIYPTAVENLSGIDHVDYSKVPSWKELIECLA